MFRDAHGDGSPCIFQERVAQDVDAGRADVKGELVLEHPWVVWSWPYRPAESRNSASAHAAPWRGVQQRGHYELKDH